MRRRIASDALEARWDHWYPYRTFLSREVRFFLYRCANRRSNCALSYLSEEPAHDGRFSRDSASTPLAHSMADPTPVVTTSDEESGFPPQGVRTVVSFLL